MKKIQRGKLPKKNLLLKYQNEFPHKNMRKKKTQRKITLRESTVK